MKLQHQRHEQPELTAPTVRVALYTRQSVERSDLDIAR